jgi:hypothetical protein
MHRVCCCGGDECQLPSTSDTITVTVRNSAPCPDCYEIDHSDWSSFQVTALDVDGTYANIPFSGDQISTRFFFSNAFLPTSSDFTLHGSGDTTCTGGADGGNRFDDPSDLGVLVKFIKSTGCIRTVSIDINQDGDKGSWDAFNADGIDAELGQWISGRSCGANPGTGDDSGVLGDGIEVKVEID